MGALIIIPAVTAKGIARNLREMLTLGVVLAVVATLLGSGIASRTQLQVGPVVVLVATAIFLLSLLLPRAGLSAAPGGDR
jgi:ABC-type Mn2+/Zn2+ transport system permease subunit